jgi:hypothetical protein
MLSGMQADAAPTFERLATPVPPMRTDKVRTQEEHSQGPPHRRNAEATTKAQVTDLGLRCSDGGGGGI